MKKKARQTRRNTVARTPWRAVSMIVVCVLLLVTGFFFAGRQHFLSMDYGMKNSKLRRQIEQLESEKRRLILARETSLSPMEIKKAAKKLGLADTPLVTAGPDAQGLPVPASVRSKAQPVKPVENASLVVKTASVTPASQPAAKTLLAKVDKADRSEKPERARFSESASKPPKKTVAAE